MSLLVAQSKTYLYLGLKSLPFSFEIDLVWDNLMVNYFSKISQVLAGTDLIWTMGTDEPSLFCRGIFFPCLGAPHSPGGQSCCHHLSGNPFSWDLTKGAFNSKTSFKVTISFWAALIKASQSCPGHTCPRDVLLLYFGTVGFMVGIGVFFPNLNNSVIPFFRCLVASDWAAKLWYHFHLFYFPPYFDFWLASDPEQS